MTGRPTPELAGGTGWLLAGQHPGEPAHLALCRGWLASFPNPHDDTPISNTAKAYRGDINQWFGWLAASGVPDPLKVGRAHVDAYARALEAQQPRRSNRTRARRLAAVSSFYAYCAQEDQVRVNPTVFVTRPPIPRSHTRSLTEDEAQALLNATDQDPDPAGLAYRVIVRLMLHSALRVGEVCRLNQGDLQTDGTLVVRRKGGNETHEPLSAATHAALADYLTGPLPGLPRQRRTAHQPSAATGLVTPAPAVVAVAGRPGRQPLFVLASPRAAGARRSRGTRITREAIRTRLYVYADRAALADPTSVTPHVLRHTALSLVAEWLPIHRVVELARHARAQTTLDTYVHPAPAGHAVHTLGARLG